MIVKVFDSEGVERDSVSVNRMTDVSTAMFAIMKVFGEQVKVDELMKENLELHNTVDELEEYKDEVDRVLERAGFEDVVELRDAYDEASSTLSDISDMVKGY